MTRPPALRADVPLSALTTLELGGPARALLEAESDAEVTEVLRWASGERLPVAVLGGGSNVVVADRGFPGLVLRMATLGIDVRAGRDDDRVSVTAAAGERWDDLVALAADEGLGGIECLAGIPGSVGATPIQNVGAYGQEVSETIAGVRVLNRDSMEVRELAPGECGFGYRSSVFRRHPDRFVVLAVTLRLTPGAPGAVRYPELARALGGAAKAPPGVAAVRDAVIELRRSKSMVLDPDDENRRSVGSFFVNPIVGRREADEVVSRALAVGVARSAADVPRFPVAEDRAKLSAAWLVERAGFARGARRGHVGISTRHSLALVHHGGGTAAELVELAGEIRTAVCGRFGVVLQPEPFFLGFGSPDPLDEA